MKQIVNIYKNQFLAKVSKAGRFLWVRSLGGSLVDRRYGVATDAAGNKATCTSSVSVVDRAAPTFDCPAATTVSANNNMVTIFFIRMSV